MSHDRANDHNLDSPRDGARLRDPAPGKRTLTAALGRAGTGRAAEDGPAGRRTQRAAVAAGERSPRAPTGARELDLSDVEHGSGHAGDHRAAPGAGAPDLFWFCNGDSAAHLPVQCKLAVSGGDGAALPSRPAGAGAALPESLRTRMETAFGSDFSAVRVHEGPEATAIGAQAFARGNDLHFAPGQYAPDTGAGQELIGHELTHVVQQSAGRVSTTQAKGGAINADPILEREADELGVRAARGEPVTVGGTAAPEVAQRTLVVDDEEVTAERIQKAGAFKTRLNRIISEEARRAKRTPASVRAGLVAMANDDTEHRFATLREAVDDAITAGLAQAESDLGTEMDEHEELDGFPRDQSWRLLMDGKHQGRGKVGFENEPGYMKAMMEGFTEMLKTLGERLTADAYEALHDLCVDGVKDRKGEDMELGFRNSSNHGEGFGIDDDNWSPTGHDELVEKFDHRNKKDPRYPDGQNPVGAMLVRHPDELMGPDREDRALRVKPLLAPRCKGLADLVLDLYYQEIAKIEEDNDENDENARLEAIVRCCQDLDQLHLFVDGNIRTIAFLVLNKLLLENGLSPVILDEPNMFDCKSVQELIGAVKRGQQAFQAMRRKE